jgi:glyoxylase-like metal-dependent hydrolase (beta-lactamase superfamily II)
MSKPVELAPNIYRIPTIGPALNCGLIVEDTGELTLIDAGYKFGHSAIVSAIEALRKKPSDVTRIVLTHAHADHAGGLKRMQEAGGARVYTHEIETPYVEQGKAPQQDRRNFMARIFAMMPFNSFTPCHIDEQITDGQLLDVGGGLRVVHTPGHTPGHVSLLHEKSGVLFVGDALFNNVGLNFSLSWSCSDIPLSRESAGRLGGLDFEVATFMHGTEIRERAKDRVKEFIAKRLGR